MRRRPRAAPVWAVSRPGTGPILQWVLAVPWGRRMLLARNHALARGVLGIALREIFAWVRAHAGGTGQTGSVTVLQRFGSALNLDLHFHVLVLDGAYVEDDQGRLHFQRSPAPGTADVQDLVTRIAERVEAWLARQVQGDDEELDDDDGLGLVQAASVTDRIGLGRRAGRRTRRRIGPAGTASSLPVRCAAWEGYNLHGGVAVGAQDRAGLERLARYLTRPALARARLEWRPDGLVVVRLKRAWTHGTTAIVLSPSELVARLAALVPPPRKNDVLYHGVLAPNARLRSRVVPEPPPPVPDRAPLARPDRRALLEGRRLSWAQLLERVFGLDGWRCPRCGEPMRLRTVVMPPATLRVIHSLHRSEQRLAQARAPPIPEEASA